MAVIPTAEPSWVRNVDFSDYGGHVDKSNAFGITTFNPITSISAEQVSSSVDHLANIVRVAPFAVLNCTVDDTLGTADITNYFGQHGIGLSNAPDVSYDGYGQVSFEWETSYTDSYSQVGTVQLYSAIVQGKSNSAPLLSDVVITTNIISVSLYDNTGSYFTDASFTLLVF